MSLLFIDGMGHYDTARMDEKYTVVDPSWNGYVNQVQWSIAAGEGRFNNAIKRYTPAAAHPSNGGYLQVSMLMNQAGVWPQATNGVCGFAFKIDDVTHSTQGFPGSGYLWECIDGNAWVLRLCLNPTGTVSAWVHAKLFTGDGPALLGESVRGIRSNEWAYIEVKWNITSPVTGRWGFDVDPTGYVVVNMNGVEILRYEGATGPSSWSTWWTGNWQSVRLLSFNNGNDPTTSWMCDLYIADGAGGAEEVNDFLGDVAVDYIVPNGVGTYSAWTPLSGANWTNVEEVPPDDDTTYVSTLTVGNRDSYAMENVAAGIEVLGFQTLVYCRKETEGGAGISPTIRTGGSDFDAAEQGIPAVTYRYLIQPYDYNPDTLARITESEINAAEFGILKG